MISALARWLCWCSFVFCNRFARCVACVSLRSPALCGGTLGPPEAVPPPNVVFVRKGRARELLGENGHAIGDGVHLSIINVYVFCIMLTSNMTPVSYTHLTLPTI